MSKKMNWKNLKENRCPDCGQRFESKQDNPEIIACEHCGYYISIKRFKEIVINILNKEISFVRY